MTSQSGNQSAKYLLLAVAAVCMVMSALGLSFFFLITAFSSSIPDGFVDNRAEWPQPVRELLAQAAREHIDAEPVKVYRVVHWTDHVFYWQMRSSPELVALMTSEWKLTRDFQFRADLFWKEWPRDWNVGGVQKQQRYLGNYGHESDNFIVVVNETEPVLYGYYYFNF